MTWNKIIGQKKVKKILQRAIIDNRIAHAYCFWGSEGVGKEALAIEFAKTVNCHEPIRRRGSIEACDTCHSCRMFDNLQHPNVQFIFSLPAGKSTDSKSDSPYSKLDDSQLDEIKEQITLKSKDYYHKIAVSGGTQIKISSIREVKRNLSMSASVEGRRCIIIIRADEMTSESSNAFLKTLEEPQENVTILMVTSRHDSILPTILSRCQQLHCPPLADEEIAESLVSLKGFEESEARLISAFAQGSYSKALEFHDEDMKSLRQNVVNLLRTALKKNTYRLELSRGIDEIIKSKDKRSNETFLILLIIWFRDVQTIIMTGSRKHVINIDQIEVIRSFAKNFKTKDINLVISVIEDAVTQSKRNVQAQLIFINLFIKIRDILL